jgi:hypothetical protein
MRGERDDGMVLDVHHVGLGVDFQHLVEGVDRALSPRPSTRSRFTNDTANHGTRDLGRASFIPLARSLSTSTH